MKLNSFKLYLFGSKINPTNPHLSLHNKVYDLWESIWSSEFSKIGSELKPDHFMRQDIIPAVVCGEEIVSVHMYTMFNLLANYTQKNPYFSGFSQTSKNQLLASGYQTMMAMEYLTVNPKWRKSVTGIAFAEVMIGIALKLMGDLPIDACFGTARLDTGVKGMVEKFGGHIVESGIKRYNLDTALMVIPKASQKKNPDQATAELIETLWRQREEQTDFFNVQETNRRAA